jgi:GNAT superfamily N-acetyltransferase
MPDLRKMNLGDLVSVVNVHLASFTGFFLSSMGDRFLQEYYKSVLVDETHIAYVFPNTGDVSGFVVGTAQPAGFYKRVLKSNWVNFLLSSIPVVMKDPFVALRLMRRIEMVQGTPFKDDYALLMSIAVEPNEQGKGIGAQLVAAFLQDAEERGCLGAILTTDAQENDLVNYFYLRRGFHLSRIFVTSGGREMNEYAFRLSELQK